MNLTIKKDRRLKKKFINGINDDDMVTDIIRELTSITKTNEITSEQVPCLAKRIES